MTEEGDTTGTGHAGCRAEVARTRSSHALKKPVWATATELQNKTKRTNLVADFIILFALSVFGDLCSVMQSGQRGYVLTRTLAFAIANWPWDCVRLFAAFSERCWIRAEVSSTEGGMRDRLPRPMTLQGVK